MKKATAFIRAIVVLLNTIIFLSAQGPGSVDESFNPGSTIDGNISALATLPNGQVYAAGAFRVMGGKVAEQIARLNSDGSVDSSFSAGTGFLNMITPERSFRHSADRIIVQNDGDILVLSFAANTFNGVSRSYFGRLKPNGTVDLSYDPALQCQGGRITAFVLLPGDRVLISGSFTNVWGQPRKYLARLNSDGSLDPSFDAARTPNLIDRPTLLTPQPDGKILIRGYYPELNHFLRLNSDGSQDETFQPAFGATNSSVKQVALEQGGKILVSRSSWSEADPRTIARLNPDGSIDPSFVVLNMSAPFIRPTPDGKLLVAGTLSTNQGLLRLNGDGSLDPTFALGGCLVTDNAPTSIALRPDNSILIAGTFDQVGTTHRRNLALVHPDGSVDPAFNAAKGISSYVLTATSLADGRIFLWGGFTNIQSCTRPGIALLGRDGRLDQTFVPDLGPFVSRPYYNPISPVLVAALTSEGKLVLGDYFITNSSPYGTVFRYVRLKEDGALDPSFHSPIIQGQQFYGSFRRAPVPLPGGKVLVFGTSIDSRPVYGIGRLLQDGNLDPEFQLDPKFTDLVSEGYTYQLNTIDSVCAAPDGKIVIAASFIGSPYPAPYDSFLVRLNSDGSLDPAFRMVGLTRPRSGGVSSGYVSAFILRDGRIIAHGPFAKVNGAEWPLDAVLCLKPDGSIDPTLVATADGALSQVLQQEDGRILMSGFFRNVNNTPCANLARLLSDGSIDPSFHIGTGPSGVSPQLTGLALDNQGDLLVHGWFSSFNGFAADNIVRLRTREYIAPPHVVARRPLDPQNGTFELLLSSSPGRTVILEANSSLAPTTWVSVLTNTPSGTPIIFRDPPAHPSRFYRAVLP